MLQINITIIGGGGEFCFQKQAFEHHSLNANKNSSHEEMSLVTNLKNRMGTMVSYGCLWRTVPSPPHERGRRREGELLNIHLSHNSGPNTTWTERNTLPDCSWTPVNDRSRRPAHAGSLLWWHYVHSRGDCALEVLLRPVNQLRGEWVKTAKKCYLGSWVPFLSLFSTAKKKKKKICSGNY